MSGKRGATKRVLDKGATLNQYEQRIKLLVKDTITADDREKLDKAYLSTYECYSTTTTDFLNTDRQCNSAVVLMRVLRSMGVNVLGVTSERTKNGEYVASGRSGMKVVYVGKHTYFTNKTSHKWRILPEDKVFFKQ